jgi:hypothetical protein
MIRMVATLSWSQHGGSPRGAAMSRRSLLLALALLPAAGPVCADCELLYAPPELRTRLLAFHHASELRRARHRAGGDAAAAPARPARPAAGSDQHAAPATPPGKPG